MLLDTHYTSTPGWCVCVLRPEVPGGEELSTAGHYGPLLASPFYDLHHGDAHLFFMSSFSFFHQGERGLDGFPGKRGETGEQVGGRQHRRGENAGGQGRVEPGTRLCRARGLGLRPARLEAAGGLATDQPKPSLCR